MPHPTPFQRRTLWNAATGVAILILGLLVIGLIWLTGQVFGFLQPVLVPLVERESGLAVLLTQRAGHLKNHPGQISFPGGRIETADANPFQAALREAHEEIGLQADNVRLLGYLDPLVTITGYRVFPAVAMLDPGYRAEPDGVEVAELFEAPLSLFLDAGNEHPFEIEFRGAMRMLKEFRWQDYRIWGATASMLINLRTRLVALS